jgi:gas vesicle protein
MSDNNSDLGAFLAGFVIGGLVGAATALILAPQSGGDTRQQILDKGRELRDTSGGRVGQYRQMADDRTRQYRERAGEALSSTRGRLQDTSGRLQDQARIVLYAGKQRVSKTRDQAEANGDADSAKPDGGSSDGESAAA